MTNPFHRARRHTTGTVLDRPINNHQVNSDFCYRTCHFVLTCSCGAGHETRYIDEALEWSSMHKEFASLADQLGEANPHHD